MRCRKCREEKDFREFAFRDKKWNIRFKVCKSCQTISPASPMRLGEVGDLALALTPMPPTLEVEGQRESKDL